MFWLKTMTSLQNWWKERNYLFIIDVLCQEAFFDKKSNDAVKARFAFLQGVRFTLMPVIRWTLFRVLFEREFRNFRKFLGMHDLGWPIIHHLSHFEAS